MIRRVPVLIFITLAVGTGLASAAQQVPPDLAEAYHQFLRARQFEAAGDVDAAIAAYRRALVLDPTAAQVSAELAGLFARENRADEAKTAAEAALAIEPDNLEAHRILGLVYIARANLPRQAEETGGRLDLEAARLAVAHLEKARPAVGGSTRVDLALGRLHLQLRQFEPAIKVLRELLVRDPEIGEASLLLASALYSTKRTAEARTVLADAVAADPSFYRGHVSLAEIDEELEDWLSAAQGYEKAGALNPRDPKMTARQVEALMKAGRLDGAIGVLEAAAVRFPRDTTLAFQLGSALEERGSHAAAEQAFRRVIATDPLHAPALNYLGYMMADRSDRIDEAVGLIKRALAVDPDNPSYLDSLGWAYFKLERLDLARGPLEQAAAALEDDSVVQDHFGDLLFKAGERAKAIAAWQKALEGDGASIDRAAIERKIRQAQDGR